MKRLIPTARRPALPLALAALTGALAMIAAPVAASRPEVRIKDVVAVENVRDNMLIGYGLVVGLAGTGDKTRNIPFAEESLNAMLERLGMNVRGAGGQPKNIAAVSITATLPAFARAGSRIDVNISALGDATSLQGGTLLAAPLKGLDGKIYAMAQGPVAVSGFKAQGAAASVSRGVTTAARIAAGAIVEREVAFALAEAGPLRLALRQPDFTTATRIANRINADFPGLAEAIDPATVALKVEGPRIVGVIAAIEGLTITTDEVARVLINEAAGTVVMTQDVRISPVAIAQGGLTIAVSETPIASQPAPLGQGETVVLPRSTVAVDDGQGKGLALAGGGASLKSLVAGLNALGVSPRDLISILQALRAAGALQAEIVVQ